MAAVLTISVSCSCEEERGADIIISSGMGATTPRSFSPRTALVEYVEVPGVKNELIITLASDSRALRGVPPRRSRCGSGQRNLGAAPKRGA